VKTADLLDSIMGGSSASLSVEKLMQEHVIEDKENISALEMVEFAYIDLYASLHLYKSQALNEDISKVDKAIRLLEEIKKVIE